MPERLTEIDQCTSHEVIEPVEQETIYLFGHPIIAVRLPDGRIAATLASLCDALDLTRYPQSRRIRDDEVISSQLLVADIKTEEGGHQSADVLTAWAIPAWLQGIKTSRLAPEKRPAILTFKLEAVDVLSTHFSQLHTSILPTNLPQLSGSSSLTLAEPAEKPLEPADTADDDAWADYHEQMTLWWRERAELKRWQHHTEILLDTHDQQLHDQQALPSRIEEMEQIIQLIPELLQRLGPQTITLEHQATVKALVARLHEVGHYAHGTIYSELGRAFQVDKYSDIRESEWSEVTQWFTTRIDSAQKRHPR